MAANATRKTSFINSKEFVDRKEAIVQSSDQADWRDSIVKVVVGVPDGITEAETQRSVLRKVNSELSKKGWAGRDNHQIVTYKIYENDQKRTLDNLDDAITKAQAGLPKDGRIVAFVMQEKSEDGVTPKMPDMMKKYEGNEGVTLVLDAYTDRFAKTRNGIMEEKKIPICPSLMFRWGIARLIQSYKLSTTNADKDKVIKEINDLRKKASPDNPEINNLEDLKNMPLIVNSICEDMEQVRAMEEKIASSV